MLLSAEESSLFLALYQHLIGFAAGRLGGVGGIIDFASFRTASWDAMAQARDRLLDNIDLIDAFVEENPGQFRETELANVLLWRHLVRGHFVIERDLAAYTVFLTEDEPPQAYGVLGLTTEFAEMLPYPMPMFATAVLLPWKGRIVCDGLMTISNNLGPGIRASLREAYRCAKTAGIITSLEPGWRPQPPRPPRAPKAPAIRRFLQKKCPGTLKELKERYGPPASQFTGAAAQGFGPLHIDGTYVLDFDSLAIYPKIIRNQTLYIYAKEDRIVCATAAERTQWSRGDLRPAPGHTLIR